MELMEKNQIEPRINPIYFDLPEYEQLPEEWNILRDIDAFDIPGLVLAGGSILPYFDKKFKVRDLDIFFLKTPYVFDPQTELYDRLIHRLTGKGYKEKSVSTSGLVRTYAIPNKPYERPKPLNMMSMEFSPADPSEWDTSVPEVQIICKTYDSISHLFDNFDLGISQFAFDGTRIVKTRIAKFNLRDNKITCLNCERPFNTLNRIVKYSQRGFDVRAALGQFLQLFAGKVEGFQGDLTKCSALLEYVALQSGDDQVIGFPIPEVSLWLI